MGIEIERKFWSMLISGAHPRVAGALERGSVMSEVGAVTVGVADIGQQNQGFTLELIFGH